ncbi:hypothetical protein EDD86DRAFT_75537 [Gorgonomyces haynaldii]|nr:hypothetical protein EDD86DRAFT_75537 [Gorgonomyces haynaldii]
MLLKQCILHYIYFGEPLVVGQKNAWMFEAAFGLLKKERSKLEIQIEEPLVLKTLKTPWFNYTEGTYFDVPVAELLEDLEWGVVMSREPAAMGFQWEKYLAGRMIDICSNDCRILFGKHKKDVGTLLNADQEPMFTKSSKVSFAEYLANHQTPFYLPDSMAGHDVVFILEMDGKKIRVFVRCKLRHEASRTDSLRSTDPKYFFCNRISGKCSITVISTRNRSKRPWSSTRSTWGS